MALDLPLVYGPFWTTQAIPYHNGFESDTLYSYQLVNYDGNLLFYSDNNLYKSSIDYDNLRRAKRICLPGGFIDTNYYNIDTSYSIYFNYDDEYVNDEVGVFAKIRETSNTKVLENKVWFDGFGRAIKHDAVNDDSSLTTSSEHDFRDRVIKSHDQLGKTDSSFYDGIDRNVFNKYPGHANFKDSTAFYGTTAEDVGLENYFVFPDSSDKISVVEYINENNHSTKEYYDCRNYLRMRKQIFGGSEAITYFDYDGLGHIRTIIRPKGDSVNYITNSLGELEREWSEDYDTIFYRYNKNGSLIRKQDGNNRAAGASLWLYYKYDDLGRITESGLTDTVITDTIPLKYYFYDQDQSDLSKGRLSMTYMVESSCQ